MRNLRLGGFESPIFIQRTWRVVLGFEPSVGIWTLGSVICLLHQGSIWSTQESRAGMHAKLLQSCLTFCDRMDCRPPGSSVHGILQESILEWVAMLSSRDLPDPGTETASLTSLALAGGFFTTSATWEAPRKAVPVHTPASLLYLEVQTLKNRGLGPVRRKQNIERISIIWVWEEPVYSMMTDRLVLSTP